MPKRTPGEKKPPFVPTRTCPHRWCRPMHLAPLPFALASVTFLMWNNWIWVVLLGLGFLSGFILPKLIHYRPQPRNAPATIRDVVDDIKASPSAIELELQDAKYEGTGWRVLEVRKWWARVAIACDIFFLLQVGLLSTVIFMNPSEEARRTAETEVSASLLYGFLFGTAFIAFQMYAHKKATTPRKPKKVWLPAATRTNN